MMGDGSEVERKATECVVVGASGLAELDPLSA
jgi:hypothetical protein